MDKESLKIIPTILISLMLLMVSCGDSPTVQKPSATPTFTVTSEKLDRTTNLTDKVKFKLDNGSEAFSLKPKENGAKLEGANGQELARLTIDNKEKIKIKNAADRVLGYVVTENSSWKIKNPEQTEELYVLRRQTDGDYKLESGSNQQVYRIKVRDYGFEIENPKKQSLYKVKIKEGKISLKNASDRIVLATKDEFLPIAVACFGFDILSKEQQAALAYAVNLSEGK